MDDMARGTLGRLRSLVGKNGWDYCVLWNVSEDQRFIAWVGCCCGGFDDNSQQCAGEDSYASCRDSVFLHPRSRACEALAEVPSSVPLDSSGIHAQVLMSNKPRWIFLSNSAESVFSEETIRTTQVLVPVPGGIVELFAEKQVPEDQQIIQFVMSQCDLITTNLYNQGVGPTAFLNYLHKTNDSNTWVPSSSSLENSNFTWDLSLDQSRLLCASPLDLTNRLRSEVGFFEGSADSNMSDKPPPTMFGAEALDDGLPEMAPYGQSVMTTARNMQHSMMMESTVSGETRVQESMKREKARRADSGSEGSNMGEEDDDSKINRTGKKLHSKNLVAERKRRKKLNDRLLSLRSLVPNISKMDRAAILGDAIDYVKELQRQVKDLQDELEKTSLDEGEQDKRIGCDDENNSHGLVVEDHNKQGGHCPRLEQEDCFRGTCTNSSVINVAEPAKQNSGDDHGQNQMEVQVEVFQISRNEFFVKVFYEHKVGGFVKLMEAMNSLGLEVTNANVTTFRPLVLNVFRVEKRDNDVVEADQVRESLLELTKGTTFDWQEAALPLEADAVDYKTQYNRRQQFSTQPHLHYLHKHL